MPLKAKGRHSISGRKAATPKAGPKKRVAKAEAELIREAVDEHGKRGMKPSRKAGKVNSFRYKDGDAKPKPQENTLEDWHRIISRTPKGPTEFERFAASLSDEQRVFASLYFKMQCEHGGERPIAEHPSLVNGNSTEFMECEFCGLVRKWHGTRTATKVQEWASYCPDGFDMFDWMDLYTKDRSLWRFIHDECLSSMVEESMEEVG